MTDAARAGEGGRAGVPERLSGWTAFRLTLLAFLSHWRRHPLQLGALLVGLAAATALWSGVQALNAEAKKSYGRAVALAGGETSASLAAPGGGRFSIALFAELRRAGWMVSPVLDGRVLLAGPRLRSVTVLGVEPLSLPGSSSFAGPDALQAGAVRDGAPQDGGLGFIRPPWRAFAAPQTMAEFALKPGATLTLADGKETPEIHPAEAAPPGTLLMDIGAAEALLDARGLVDRLLLDQAAPAPEGSLEDLLDGRLVASEPPENDFGRMTGSLHLCLTAFGLLSFAVGLFIAHAAAGLAFEQRRGTLRTVRALGVSARTAAAALVAELVAAALIAGVVGLAIGYAIAGALAPGVAATLRGLYGAPAAGVLSFDPLWAVSGLAMGLLGALLAAGTSLWKAYRLPILSSVGAEAWRAAQSRWLIRQGALGATLLLAAALLTVLLENDLAQGLYAAFALLACLMLGAALALPAVLAGLLELGRARARRPAALWFWADARRELSGLSFALAALLLALAANIGVSAMVGGFRDAFRSWLDARLAAEVYVNARTESEAAEMRRWAAARPEVEAALPRWWARSRLDGAPIDLLGFTDHATYRDNWPLLSATDDVWDRAALGQGALISEQLARRVGLGVGDALTLRAQGGPWRLEIVGVYADYGNPRGQVAVSGPALGERFPSADTTSFALRVPPERVAPLLAEMREQFQLGEGVVVDQRRLKAFAYEAFENTFVVTGALSALTFAVAGIALLASLASLGGRRLAQLAPLWALGLARRRLAALDLAQTLALALAVAVIAAPLGLALAWALVAVVNVEAFGWRLPLGASTADIFALLGLAAGAAALAAAPGYWRLRRAEPARLLRLLTEER